MLAKVFELYKERHDFFLQLLVEHIELALMAILIASAVGFGIGILISHYRKVSAPVIAAVNVIYTIPSIALLGFLIPVTGIGNKTAIIALIVYAIMPMVRNTYTGVTSVDPAIIEAAKGMGSTPFQIMFRVRVPLAVPVILAGARNMVVMVISMTGIASYIGAGGLGVAIYRGITINNLAMTVAGGILIACLAVAADLSIGGMEKHYKRRRRLQ